MLIRIRNFQQTCVIFQHLKNQTPHRRPILGRNHVETAHLKRQIWNGKFAVSYIMKYLKRQHWNGKIETANLPFQILPLNWPLNKEIQSNPDMDIQSRGMRFEASIRPGCWGPFVEPVDSPRTNYTFMQKHKNPKKENDLEGKP